MGILVISGNVSFEPRGRHRYQFVPSVESPEFANALADFTQSLKDLRPQTNHVVANHLESYWRSRMRRDWRNRAADAELVSRDGRNASRVVRLDLRAIDRNSH